jgi:cation transport ATPase
MHDGLFIYSLYRDSVRALLNVAPESATRIGPDGTEWTVPAADLRVGGVVLVRPGERVAADGTVVGGASEVDPTDRVRPEAADTVTAVTRLTGTAPVLLTGDNHATAMNLAPISDVRAELPPGDKVNAVRELESWGQRVMVVGDGVNDAPALAAAHTGIAMGGAGADLTVHAADAVIVRDDLTAILSVIALSRRARRVVTSNLIIAATFGAAITNGAQVRSLPPPPRTCAATPSATVAPASQTRRHASASRPRGLVVLRPSTPRAPGASQPSRVTVSVPAPTAHPGQPRLQPTRRFANPAARRTAS